MCGCRSNGTTIPLYDKRAELYASKVDIVRTVPAGKQKVGAV